MFQHGDRSVSTLNLGTHLVLNQPTSAENLTMSDVALTRGDKRGDFPSDADVNELLCGLARRLFAPCGNNACTYMALWRYESSLGPGRFRRGDE